MCVGTGKQINQGAHSYRLASLRMYPAGYLGTWVCAVQLKSKLPTCLCNYCRCPGGW